MERLSYSQLNGYLTCGSRFYYERMARLKLTGERLPNQPSWAQVGGSAVHAMTEELDRYDFGMIESLKSWEEHLEEAVADQEERSGYTRDGFKNTGRKSAAWPEKENRDWWMVNGPKMVNAWTAWNRMVPWSIAILDGEPAIELEFDLEIKPGVIIKGFIDRVYEQPDGTLVVVDLKSGSREPNDGSQLGVYALAIATTMQVPVHWGGFWMARSGNMGELWNLRQYTQPRLEYEYGALAQLKRDRIYLPHSSMLCGSCGVRDFCPSQNGTRADEISQPWETVTIDPVEVPA